MRVLGSLVRNSDSADAFATGGSSALTVGTGIGAGTNAQGQGALTNDLNIVTTTAASPSGVTLPTATVGRTVIIENGGTNPINVYPATGAGIDNFANNLPLQIPVGAIKAFYATTTTKWYSTEDDMTVLGDNTLYTTTTPNTPLEGVALYGVKRANRRMLGYKTPTGRTERLGPWMGSNNTVLVQANYNVTTMTSIGAVLTAVTAATAIPYATTNFLTVQRRNQQTISTLGGMIEQWGPLMCSRAPGNGGGGFHAAFRFGIVALNIDAKLFCGFTSAAAAMTNVNPSTLFNIIGLGKDATDTTTLALFANGASGTAQKIALPNTGTMTGIANAFFQVELFTAAGGTQFGYRVTRTSSAGAETIDEGVTTGTQGGAAGIPADATAFAPHLWGASTTAVATTLQFSQFFMDSD